jgi:glucose-6-phosphate 1-dehydrogenase
VTTAARPPRPPRAAPSSRAKAARPASRSANPLRAGLRLEKVPDPCIMVIFGGTGDLSHRKILPALYNLTRAGLLPAEETVVAFARRPYTDEAYRTEMGQSVTEFSRVPVEPALWHDFSAGIFYQAGDFTDQAAYQALATRLEALDAERGTRGNRLFYVAAHPSAYSDIIANLGRAGLARPTRGSWVRIIIEKPFGRDLASARALNHEVTHVFDEGQVYRIDHYLGKETVRNLMVFRFGNGIFEPVWNRRYVDHVQITVAEDLGMEGRGQFYEEAGASRDILQNHLLQLTSLVAMEPPIAFEADALRDEKLRVLRAIEPAWDAERIRRDVVRGQYGPGWVGGVHVPGYRDEPDVAPTSTTETYVALKLEVQNWRWADVPFYLRTGKRLPKRATEISVQFKRPPLMLFREATTEPEPNLLALRIQPDEGIMLRFAAKVPELGLDVRSVNMDFTYGSSFTTEAPEAYETLLLDAMVGDASLFTRADEVEAAWAIVTPLDQQWAAWDKRGDSGDLATYEAGTWGPGAADQLLERDGRRWRRL